MKKILIFALFFYLNTLFYSTAQELELMHVIFSQPDRYPDRDEKLMAGSDSYDYIVQNDADYGLLTQKGKRRISKFGDWVREAHATYLGEYKDNDVYARYTAIERTKESLLSFLAGLYPATRDPPFSNETYSWTIPIDFRPISNDFLLVTKNPKCGILKLRIDKEPEVVERMKPYKGFYEELRAKTNISTFAPRIFSLLYHYVESISSMDLDLPNWCTEEDERKLREVTAIHYESLGLKESHRKAIAGPIIDQVLRDIQNNEKKQRKIYIYSGHPVNIASFVQAHNATGIPSIPEYGSAIFIITFKLDDNQRYIQMTYRSGVSEQTFPLNVPNCENQCLLDTYMEIMGPIIPNDQEKACYGGKRTDNHRAGG